MIARRLHPMALAVEIAFQVARNQVLVVLEQVEHQLVVDVAELGTGSDVHAVDAEE